MTLDTESLAVIEFLTALKTCEDILQELPNELRLWPEIKHANVGRTSFTGKPYHVRLADATSEQFFGAAQLLVTVC